MVALVLVSGCASVIGPLITHESASEKHNNSPSRFAACGTSGYIVGGAIDTVIGAGDLLLGEEIDAIDALVVAPLALDILIGAVQQISCHQD